MRRLAQAGLLGLGLVGDREAEALLEPQRLDFAARLHHMTAGLMRDRGQGADAREPAVGLRRQRRVGGARVELDATAAGVAGDLRHRRARPAALPRHRGGRLAEALARRLPGFFLLLVVRDVEAGAAAGPARRGRDRARRCRP